MGIQQRAMQLWPILALAARNHQVLNYGIVGRAIGAPPVAIGQWLGPIQSYCLRQGLPPLTVLVVNQETGVPGDGFIAAENVPQAQMQVFAFDWLDHGPPPANELSETES